MKLDLITLSTIKTQLGLTDSTHDAAITAMIPIVSSDVRRILNTNYRRKHLATLTIGSDKMIVAESRFFDDVYKNVFEMGQVMYSTSLADDTYITNYDFGTGEYTLSAVATGDSADVFPTLIIAQWPTVSKMIWYKTTVNNTSSANIQNVKSESYGPVSVSYADSEINKQYNYPQILIDDLGVPFAEVG